VGGCSSWAPAVKAASKYPKAINAAFRWLEIESAVCEVLKKKGEVKLFVGG